MVNIYTVANGTYHLERSHLRDGELHKNILQLINEGVDPKEILISDNINLVKIQMEQIWRD